MKLQEKVIGIVLNTKSVVLSIAIVHVFKLTRYRQTDLKNKKTKKQNKQFPTPQTFQGIKICHAR